MMKKKKGISLVFEILKYVFLTLAALCALIPVCVCVLTAFKTNEEYAATSVLDLPQSFLNFDNFVTAFQKANMLRGFLNTGLVLVVVLTASIFMGSMLAYVLNRFKFPGRGLVQYLQGHLSEPGIERIVYDLLHPLNIFLKPFKALFVYGIAVNLIRIYICIYPD